MSPTIVHRPYFRHLIYIYTTPYIRRLPPLRLYNITGRMSGYKAVLYTTPKGVRSFLGLRHSNHSQTRQSRWLFPIARPFSGRQKYKISETKKEMRGRGPNRAKCSSSTIIFTYKHSQSPPLRIHQVPLLTDCPERLTQISS